MLFPLEQLGRLAKKFKVLPFFTLQPVFLEERIYNSYLAHLSSIIALLPPPPAGYYKRSRLLLSIQC